MSSLKRIFTVIEDIPTITPVGINIPCFKELYTNDFSIDKHYYAQQLAYIYHMTAYDSPYYDSRDKEKVVAERFLENEDYVPTALVRRCMQECLDRESVPERRTLDAAISLCDTISENALAMKKENTELTSLLQEIDAQIKNEKLIDRKIDLMTKKQALEKAALDKATNAAKLIASMQGNTEKLVALRKTVAQAQAELEANNKDAISNHMIDDFINKYGN